MLKGKKLTCHSSANMPLTHTHNPFDEVFEINSQIKCVWLCESVCVCVCVCVCACVRACKQGREKVCMSLATLNISNYFPQKNLNLMKKKDFFA